MSSILTTILIIVYFRMHNDVLLVTAGVLHPTGLSIMPPWSTIYRYVNERYIITCTVEPSGVNFTISGLQKWTFNNDLITEEIEGLQLNTTVVNSVSLTFTNISKQHEGRYTCSVKGSPLSQSFELFVTEPVVMNCDVEVEVKEENDACLKCIITGSPKPYVKWAFNGINLGEGINDNDKYIWKISNVKREDAGEYTCSAYQNPYQRSDNKRTIKLIVYHAPVFGETNSNRTIYVPPNETAVVEYKVFSNPPARFIWYQDDNQYPMIPRCNRVIITNTDDTTSLQITMNNSSYFGRYKCEAQNELGSAMHSVDIVETIELLKPEIGLWNIDTESVQFYVSTQKEADYYSFQVAYDTHYDVGNEKWLTAINVNITLNKALSILKRYGLFEIPNLYPFTKYAIRVAAVNQYIMSAYSEEKKFVTRIRVGQLDTSLCSKALSNAIPSFWTIISYFLIIIAAYS